MSAECWIELGSHFGTCHYRSGGIYTSQKWFLPKGSISDEILKCIRALPTKPEEIHVTSQLAHKIIGQRGGASIALLVTEGFQEWPLIRQPIKRKELSKNIKRPKPLLDPDFIFGVTERIDANGNVITPVSDEDLDFLIGKFQMAGIEQVAIGFLHSKQNSEHEIKAAEKLKAAGFEVFCSHSIEESSNEVARWWRVFLNAYVGKSFESFQEDLDAVAEATGLPVFLIDSFGQTFNNDSSKTLDTAFSHWAMKLKMAENKPYLYLGLEEFAIVLPEKDVTPWRTEFGPIYVPRYKIHTTSLQPTQIIETDVWGLPTLSKEEIGYEPGPMIWGRSLKPTFVDLICYHHNGIDIPDVEFDTSPKMLNKIEEIARTYINVKSDDSPGEVLRNTYELSLQTLAQELVQLELVGTLPVFGPLSESMILELNLLLKRSGLVLKGVKVESP